MITVIEKDIQASSLCFWGTATRPENTDPIIPLGESFSLDVSSHILYNNMGPGSDGHFPSTPKIVNKISVEPLWTYSYLSPSSIVSGPPLAPVEETYSAYFADVIVQPFIASPRLNNRTRNFFAFSATNDGEWTTNQWGPSASPVSVENDVHFDDKFVLQPNEALKIKLYAATLSGTIPPAPLKMAAIRYEQWYYNWIKSPQPVVKVRVELQDFVPSSQYYYRASLNDIAVTPGSPDFLTGDQDITLLDLRDGAVQASEKPFDKLFDFNSFQVQNLDFRGAYPWGGVGSTKFMYSIILDTHGDPGATRYIRKYVRFAGDNASDLEINGLLKNIGPLSMKRGQHLKVRLYTQESAIPSVTEALSNRQMPAFWLNGTIT